VTPEQIEKTVSLYRADVILREISAEVGVSLPVLKRWLKANRDSYKLEHRAKGVSRRIDHCENDAEASSWNLKLGCQYIVKNWSLTL